MKNAIITVKINPLIKKRAQQVADDLGFGLSSLINGFLNHLIKTKTIEFSAYPKEEPTEYLRAVLQEGERQLQDNEVITFEKPQDALAYVDRMVK